MLYKDPTTAIPDISLGASKPYGERFLNKLFRLRYLLMSRSLHSQAMPVRFLDPRNKGFFLFGLRFRTVLQEVLSEENSPRSASESVSYYSWSIISTRDGEDTYLRQISLNWLRHKYSTRVKERRIYLKEGMKAWLRLPAYPLFSNAHCLRGYDR